MQENHNKTTVKKPTEKNTQIVQFKTRLASARINTNAEMFVCLTQMQKKFGFSAVFSLSIWGIRPLLWRHAIC